jgi:hypothetical protein
MSNPAVSPDRGRWDRHLGRGRLFMAPSSPFIRGGANEGYNMKSFNILFALAFVSAAPGIIGGAFAYSGEKLAKEAKITMEQATAIALKVRPGKIADKELEREHGGSGLRYSFDVVGKGVTYEVGVDAQTGAVLENGRDGAHPD